MTRLELEAIAFKIATGNCLTKAMDEVQWNNSRTSSYTLEAFENIDGTIIDNIVRQIADDIINTFNTFTIEPTKDIE